MRTVTKATARWDRDDYYNPGWVVDVEYPGGRRESFPAAPCVYHSPEDEDPALVVEKTLEWESLRLDA